VQLTHIEEIKLKSDTLDPRQVEKSVGLVATQLINVSVGPEGPQYTTSSAEHDSTGAGEVTAVGSEVHEVCQSNSVAGLHVLQARLFLSPAQLAKQSEYFWALWMN
jgi:hypothetical protein